MAIITVKMTQAALDARNSATIMAGEAAGTVNGALDSALTIYDLIADNYYYFSSVKASATQVAYRYADGASVTLKGGLDYPAYGYGNATITKSSFLLPGILSAEASGASRAYFNYDGSYTTSYGTINNLKVSVLDASLSMIGKSSSTISGSLQFDSGHNLSGTISSFVNTGSKIIQSSEIAGNFTINSGNMRSPSGTYSNGVIGKYANVSGTLTKFNEKYYDGSLISANFSASPVSLSNGESINLNQLSDESNMPGDDVLDIALPAVLPAELIIRSGTGNDIIKLAGGGSLLNVDAGDGNDTITLIDGNHLCFGGSGNDTLVSGKGNDTLLGGAGDDTYTINTASDVVYETTTVNGNQDAGGTDLILSSVSYALGDFIENLTLTTGKAALNITGNSLANILIGNDGANVLNGGAGNDTMLGGAGNDTYIVDAVGDMVYETKGIGSPKDATGKDVVRASVSYQLGSFVEDLVLTGSGALSGTGNSLANTVTGNDAANALDGGAGNDILVGGGGDDTLIGGVGIDTLTGGIGADVFAFKALAELGTGKTRDVITDFAVGIDKLDLSAIDAVTTSDGDQPFRWVTNFTASAGEVRFALVNGIGTLFLNTDSDTAAEYEIQLTGVNTLTAADLVL